MAFYSFAIPASPSGSVALVPCSSYSPLKLLPLLDNLLCRTDSEIEDRVAVEEDGEDRVAGQEDGEDRVAGQEDSEDRVAVLEESGSESLWLWILVGIIVTVFFCCCGCRCLNFHTVQSAMTV